jgi:hypothetical protein
MPPGAGEATHVCLTAETPLDADVAGEARHLAGERAQLIDHGVDRVLERQDLAARLDRDLLRQVTLGDRCHDLRDVAHLRGEVLGHRVHVGRELAPHPRGAAHLGLAAQNSVRAHLARDARELRGERAQLIDHGVDVVLVREQLTAHLDRDLL